MSAYYKIKSKQPHSFYVNHIQRWFQSISVPVVFFTTPDLQEEFESWGINLSHVRFINLPFEELNAWKKFGRGFWDRQAERDVEKYHTPELAAIWFEKKEFVERAFTYSPADIFVWCDAGCIRSPGMQEVARNFCKRNYPSLNNGKLHVQSIRHQPVKEYYVYPEYRFACAILAGNRQAWINHSRLYDSIAEFYDSKCISCNSDQYITQACSDRYPEYYTEIMPSISHVERWFFFLYIL